MSSYYVRRMGYVLGQFSAADLKARALSGELQPDDEVSRDQERWVPASDVGGLEFVAPPPPEFPYDEILGSGDGATQLVQSPPKRSTNLEACPDCGELVSVRATACPHCGCPIKSPPPLPQVPPRFRLLRTLSIIYMLGGVLSVIAIGLGLCIFLYSLGRNDGAAAMSGLAIAGSALPVGATCFVIAEVIDLFLQIEENTRRTAEATSQRR